MNKIKQYAAIVALLGATSLGLAACGGETPTATRVMPTATTVPPTATTAPSATSTVVSSTTGGSTTGASGAGMDLLNKADAAMKGVKSYHLVMKTDAGGVGAVQAEGDFMLPDNARLTMDLGSGLGKTEMIIIGQDSYIKNPAGDGYISTGSTGMGMTQSLSPSQFSSLAQGAQNVSVVGDETIDGVSTTHLKFSYDMGKMAAQSATAAGQPTPAGLTGTATADMWIEKDTNYIRQFKFVSPSTAVPGMTTPTATGDTTITITYSKFNESVSPPIEKPTNVVTIPGASEVQTAMPGAAQMATNIPSTSDLATALPGASEIMTALPIGGSDAASTPTP